MVPTLRRLVGRAVFFGVVNVFAWSRVFEVSVFVADLGGAAGAIEEDLLADEEPGTIEDEADDAAYDADDREEDGADFEVAEKDKRLDDEAARITEDDHGAGLDAEETGCNEQDGCADGQHPGGSAQISPR